MGRVGMGGEGAGSGVGGEKWGVPRAHSPSMALPYGPSVLTHPVHNPVRSLDQACVRTHTRTHRHRHRTHGHTRNYRTEQYDTHTELP